MLLLLTVEVQTQLRILDHLNSKLYHKNQPPGMRGNKGHAGNTGHLTPSFKRVNVNYAGLISKRSLGSQSN